MLTLLLYATVSDYCTRSALLSRMGRKEFLYTHILHAWEGDVALNLPRLVDACPLTACGKDRWQFRRLLFNARTISLLFLSK